MLSAAETSDWGCSQQTTAPSIAPDRAARERSAAIRALTRKLNATPSAQRYERRNESEGVAVPSPNGDVCPAVHAVFPFSCSAGTQLERDDETPQTY